MQVGKVVDDALTRRVDALLAGGHSRADRLVLVASTVCESAP